MSRPRNRRRIIGLLVVLFIFTNVVAALHAWRFTHFTPGKESRHKGPKDYTFGQKLGMALTGVNNPRPMAGPTPSIPYTHIILQGASGKIDAWHMPATQLPAKGTVILLHGYGGEKSGMLPKAQIFLDLGYNVLLPDFRGSGASDGNTTTIGYKEAEDVKVCWDYVSTTLGEQKVILAGISMGAVAIMKCISDTKRQPTAIIIECPFGTLYQTVCKRFQMVNMPVFPMAGLITFWGGVEHGFWAFSHRPVAYAKAVKCPALLLYGAKDDRVDRNEIDAIYASLVGPKTLHVFPDAGHNDVLVRYREEWMNELKAFLAWSK